MGRGPTAICVCRPAALSTWDGRHVPACQFDRAAILANSIIPKTLDERNARGVAEFRKLASTLTAPAPLFKHPAPTHSSITGRAGLGHRAAVGQAKGLAWCSCRGARRCRDQGLLTTEVLLPCVLGPSHSTPQHDATRSPCSVSSSSSNSSNHRRGGGGGPTASAATGAAAGSSSRRWPSLRVCVLI